MPSGDGGNASPANDGLPLTNSIEDIPIMIIKKDKRREVFNRDKVRSGLLKACEKREISMNVIEAFVDELERDLRESEAKGNSIDRYRGKNHGNAS